MKKIFKKAVTVLGSIALVGATVGGAAAAAYPTPFGTDYAVVYGSADDLAAATTIAGGLPSLGGTGGTTSGGDSYKFERTSTAFHLGDGFQTVKTTLDDDELASLLAPGKFIDDDNDEFDYTQKISMVNNTLTMWSDNDYIEDEPTVGFRIPSSTAILNYTLTFSDNPLIGDLVTTSLPIMGKTYYVLSNSTSSAGSLLVLTLLDSATDATLTEGASKQLTVEGTSYDTSINFISATEVVLVVNGETTNSLNEGTTYKLSDGSYVGIKDIRYNTKEGTVSTVEFSIGSGKLKLTSGSEVQINDVAVSGLTTTIANSSATAALTTLTSIALHWAADDDLFVTENTEITMPGFEVVKISYTGLTYPTEETIEIAQGGDTYATLNNFPLKDGSADIDFLYGAAGGGFSGIGKDGSNKLITSNTTTLTFDKDTDENFIVSYAATTEGESYLMRATNFVLDSTTNKTDIQYYKNGAWVTKKSGAKESDTISMGNAEIGIGRIDRTQKTVVITANDSATNFFHLYSKEGLRTYLPFSTTTNNSVGVGTINFQTTANTSVGHNATSFYLNFSEEDKDGNIGSGKSFAVQVGWDSSTVAEVEVSDLLDENVTAIEIQDTDVWRSFMYSALATEFLWNKPTSGQDSIKIIYHGSEVEANVYVTSPETTVGGGTGTKVFMDSEASSYAGKNLVVVGGSCVNSVAATLLGGSLCAADFTGVTAVEKGEFMIKTFDHGGKLATVVAGYDKEDTTKAATYLANKVDPIPEIAAGVAYEGTSATESATRLN